MAWEPANISTACQQHPTLLSCQTSILSFMTFLVQNFGRSSDEAFRNFENKPFNEYASVKEEYDFIIVGAGTAGCVVANRLSEIKNWKILLLEAGSEEPVVADVPGFYRMLSGSSIDWNYKSEKEKFACKDTKNQRCPLTRGKVMGGSSTLNGMAYVRGNAEDYDNWDKLGNKGWSYEEVLPYFLKSEDNRVVANDTDIHSTGGFLTVDYYPYTDNNGRIIIDAWKELGFDRVDYNSRNQIGVNAYQSTIIHGARQSSNGAFIRPIRGKRPNLVIRTNALATKILINPLTKRTIGVEYSVAGDKRNLRKAYAKKEVIISGGVFESPKLLMLSGIGPLRELLKAGMKVIKDLPVGDNLQDHVLFPASIGILNDNLSTVVPVNHMKSDALYWLSTHEGPLSSIGSVPNIMTFLQTPLEKRFGVPDIQIYHFENRIEDIELLKNYNGFPSTYFPVSYYNAFAVTPTLIHVKSRGTVRLNDRNPIWSHPKINLNFFSNPEDLSTIVKGALYAKDLFKTDAFKKAGIKVYPKPAEACKDLPFESDKYYECVAINYSRPGLHLVGTCKMGPQNDTTAVVDPKLRVHGVKGLRVIDASIMPSVPKGNSYCPTIMIAEKGSDMIKEEWLQDNNIKENSLNEILD